VSQRGVPERIVDDAVAAWERLDILINNAGDQITRCPISDTPDDLFDRQMNINVRSVFEACRGGVRHFRKQGGVIIMSDRSRAARATESARSSTLTQRPSRARSPSEVAPDRIRVNGGLVMSRRTSASSDLRSAWR
jgi:3-oxoacyl-[acyl-carrier protein] reductase